MARRKNALVIGIANESSISAAIAKELYENGYNIIPTYLNERALTHVKKVTDQLGVETLFPFQSGDEKQLQDITDYLNENDINSPYARVSSVIMS